MKPKWQKLASLAQKICTLWFQFFGAVFASKGYPFKNILEHSFSNCEADMSSVPFLFQTSCRRACSLLYLHIDINELYIAYYIGAEFVRAEFVRGRVCQGPS